MLPFLPIVAQLLPDLVKLFGSDQADTIATAVAKAVKEVTGETETAKAQAALKATPELSDALREKLAQIAIDASKAENEAAQKRDDARYADLQKQREFQNEQLRDYYAALDRKSTADFERLKAGLQDVAAARGQQAEYVKSGSPVQWVAPAVSAAVILVFFFVIYALINTDRYTEYNEKVLQIINITVGALVAAFTAVVNYWIGSSMGSREKDTTLQQTTEASAKQAAEITNLRAALPPQDGAPKPNQPSAGTPATKSPGDKPDNFLRCLEVTLLQEGGYGNHPLDPGGPTNLGITLQTLRNWRHDQTLTADDVHKMPREEAIEIYRSNYWNVARCTDLPLGIDLEVFDMAVNAGPSRSVKILQLALGVTVDGSVGSETLRAVANQNATEIINAFSEGRLKFYQSLPTFGTFGRGWTNRVNTVRQKALDMSGGKVS